MDPVARPDRLLIVMAHPDDLEFAAAGAVAQWTAEGTDAQLCLCTRGESGCADPAVGAREIAATRMGEAGAAARLLGIGTVLTLDHADGALDHGTALVRDLTRAIRERRPDTVLCPDPTLRFDPWYINHPDHVAAGEATLRAVYPSAQDARSFPELALPAHKVSRVLLSSPRTPNAAVDISAGLAAKIAALTEHRSQLDPDSARRLVTDEARRLGREHGLPGGRGVLSHRGGLTGQS